MSDREARIRTGLGLGVIAVTLLLIPLLLNVSRGGARGVGYDPRTDGTRLLIAATYPSSVAEGPLDGRLIVVLAREGEPEPRFQVEAGPSGQQVFAVEVEAWRPGHPLEVTDTAFGFPLPALGHVPPGHYWVQGVLDVYRSLRLPSGETVRLPAEPGEAWNERAGNLVSRPVEVYVDPRSRDVIRVDLSRTVPRRPTPADTGRALRVRVPSERLSAFWGREVFHEATVRLPRGWDERPEAAWPLLVHLGPAGGEAPELPEGAFVVAAVGWGGPWPGAGRAVNSPTLGPWGDALVHELVPELEGRFRGVGGPRGRALLGWGVGGWEALAAQVSHPDAFAGAWAVCPGPVDFHAFAGVDLYRERNAFRFERAWGATPRPAPAAHGRGGATLEQENHLELVLGTRGRSAGTWDTWQALFSPLGPGAYPRPAWDKRTGLIDPEVVAHWRDSYDLRHVLERDLTALAPVLAGRLSVVVGEADLHDPAEGAHRLAAFLDGPDSAGAYGRGVVRGGGFGRCAAFDPGAAGGVAEALTAEIAERLGAF